MLGAICGDILGSTYEFEEKKYEDPSKIKLCLETDNFTDDTALTLAVADWLLNDLWRDGSIDGLKAALAKQLYKYSRKTFKKGEGKIGFGQSYFKWCVKGELLGDFSPYNSYGNGSAMRVSPVGWFFNSLKNTLYYAKLSADVTHNHPEGEKGAMCIAAAIFLARNGKSKQEIKDYLLETFEYDLLNKSVAEHRRDCQWSEICQDTVPMAVVAFLESTDYKSAIQNALSYGSDSDTIADMAGAIAEAYYGEIPADIREFCLAKIPPKQQELIGEFYRRITEIQVLKKLAEMCQDSHFDQTEAVCLMKKADINRMFEFAGFDTTLLETAIECFNLEMVALLLENGADPNQDAPYGNPFWGLQYSSCEGKEKDEILLKIAQLCLEHGADPFMDPDQVGEGLFDYVLHSSGDDEGDQLIHRNRFLLLLIAYSNNESIPYRSLDKKKLDKNKLLQYKVSEKNPNIFLDENGEKIIHL